MLRTNTPASPACRFMRTRSPSTAPPLNGLVGSTARTATRCPASRIVAISWSTSVLLPPPGTPVTPTRYARPVRGKSVPTTAAAPPSPSLSSICEMARAIARGSPSSTRSASASGGAATGVAVARHEMAGDDQSLNLARALADRGQLHVAEELLGRVVLHEAVAAVDLHAVFGGAHGNLARIELGHRGFDAGARPGILERGSPIGQEPRSLDARGVVDQSRA